MAIAQLLVLGTHNRNKTRELVELLGAQGFELRTLADFPHAIQVRETGNTFAENAAQKAVQQARHLGLWVLGEDSGLVVEALAGKPGIYSARYAGDNATDASNNRRLLQELAGIPLPERAAHYVCHVTLSDPAGNVRAECEASCFGRISCQSTGDAGFGYDPLFEILEYHRTLGELGAGVKSLLSHRARAFRRLIPSLEATFHPRAQA